MSGPEVHQPKSDYRGPIVNSVRGALQNLGFSYEALHADRSNTQIEPYISSTLQIGPYRYESYLFGSANLALLELPPHTRTEANHLIGPSDERKASFFFKVYTLAGDGELLVSRPGSHDVRVVPLYPGAPVLEIRPGEVYAYRAGYSRLTVLDYCDPAFEEGFEKPVAKETVLYEGLRLPERFWDRLEFEQNRPDLPSTDGCERESC